MWKYIALIYLVFLACNEVGIDESDKHNVVVTGYMYVNRPLTDNIRLTSMLSYSAGETKIENINDAKVTIFYDDLSEELVPQGTKGFYTFADPNKKIESGKTYKIEIDYYDKIAKATTIVPEKPRIASLSDTEIFIEDSIDFMEMMQNLNDYPKIKIKLDNNSAYYHYLLIENIETKKEVIWLNLPSGMRDYIYISSPSQKSELRLSSRHFMYYGKHQVIAFRVNKEYVDAYESRYQSPSTLNEPVSNVDKGLGLFTSFDADTAFFTVTRKTTDKGINF